MSSLQTGGGSDSFLPTDDEPQSGQQQLDALQQALDPVASPVDLIVTAAPPPPVGRSYDYSFLSRRFVRAPGGKAPLGTIGESTLKLWVEKCLSTERGAHPIHPPGYGLASLSDLYGGPVTAPPADLEQRISDALTFHPRIASVTDFGVTDDPDDEYVSVTFSVVTDRDETIPIPPIQVSL